MSKKSSKVSLKPKQPRSIEAITKEAGDVQYRLGGSQYLVYVYTQEVETISKRLLELNKEAAARQQLDAQKAASEAPKTEGETNEQA